MENLHSGKRFYLRKFFFILFFVGAVWSFGFAHFISSINQLDRVEQAAEGIVVLTGGQGRIDAGLDALKNQLGSRLLISGINQELNAEIIMQAISEDVALLECCIDLGPFATDTVSNAEETARWAQKNGYQRIIIITSDYHMPRALLAFRPYNQDLELLPAAVRSGVSPLLLMREYNKYLLNLAGIGVKT